MCLVLNVFPTEGQILTRFTLFLSVSSLTMLIIVPNEQLITSVREGGECKLFVSPFRSIYGLFGVLVKGC